MTQWQLLFSHTALLLHALSNHSASLFHLFNHAFFKALLFLPTGSIIHALVNQQDLRRVDGLAIALADAQVLRQRGDAAVASRRAAGRGVQTGVWQGRLRRTRREVVPRHAQVRPLV